MKSLANFCALIAFTVTSLLYSCKNNQDGYSDELETRIEPSDTVSAVSDSLQNTNEINPSSISPAVKSIRATTPDTTAAKTTTESSTAQSKTGTGIGPGPSPQDGSAYAINSGVQKDSVKPEIKKREK
jgi:hypothetical protein